LIVRIFFNLERNNLAYLDYDRSYDRRTNIVLQHPVENVQRSLFQSCPIEGPIQFSKIISLNNVANNSSSMGVRFQRVIPIAHAYTQDSTRGTRSETGHQGIARILGEN